MLIKFIIFYPFIALSVGILYSISMEMLDFNEKEIPPPSLIGIFFPIMVPILLLFAAGWAFFTFFTWLSKIAKRPFQRKRNKDGEITPGVPNPSTILVDMLGAEMLKSPESIKQTSSAPSPTSYKNYIKFLWISKKGLEISWMHPFTWTGREMPLYGVSLRTPPKRGFKNELELSYAEKEVLADFIRRAVYLKEEFDKARKEAERQQEAVDAIETFFKTTTEASDEST